MSKFESLNPLPYLSDIKIYNYYTILFIIIVYKHLLYKRIHVSADCIKE